MVIYPNIFTDSICKKYFFSRCYFLLYCILNFTCSDEMFALCKNNNNVFHTVLSLTSLVMAFITTYQGINKRAKEFSQLLLSCQDKIKPESLAASIVYLKTSQSIWSCISRALLPIAYRRVKLAVIRFIYLFKFQYSIAMAQQG